MIWWIFRRRNPKNKRPFFGNCIYWRPQHWRLVVDSEVVNPECINYIYWRPYLVWFIFVHSRSGGWFGAQNSVWCRSDLRNNSSQFLGLRNVLYFPLFVTDSHLYHIFFYQASQSLLWSVQCRGYGSDHSVRRAPQCWVFPIQVKPNQNGKSFTHSMWRQDAQVPEVFWSSRPFKDSHVNPQHCPMPEILRRHMITCSGEKVHNC